MGRGLDRVVCRLPGLVGSGLGSEPIRVGPGLGLDWAQFESRLRPSWALFVGPIGFGLSPGVVQEGPRVAEGLRPGLAQAGAKLPRGKFGLLKGPPLRPLLLKRKIATPS